MPETQPGAVRCVVRRLCAIAAYLEGCTTTAPARCGRDFDNVESMIDLADELMERDSFMWRSGISLVGLLVGWRSDRFFSGEIARERFVFSVT